MATDLSTLVKSIFKDKRNYSDIEDKDKASLLFVFNRYVARNYPDNANFFNKRGMDGATAMDIWFDYFRDSLYMPGWFYPPRVAKKEKLPVDAALDAIPSLDDMDKYLLKTHFSHLVEHLIEHNRVVSDEDLQTVKLKKIKIKKEA